MDDLVGKIPYLKWSAQQAFLGYIRSYESHKLKEIFNTTNLNNEKACRSFGLIKVPSAEQQVYLKNRKLKRR